MAYDDSVTISFRLSFNKEEDKEILRFFSSETMKICYGDKSEFIKSALIRAVQDIKRNENDNRLICEMNTQRTVIQETMTGEADRVINAIKLIVRDEMERITGTQMLKGKQAASKMTESVAEGSIEVAPCFGEVPESSCEDDLLMEFVAKHTSDKFCLIDNVNTSIRGIIAREVIGNILVHRDYSSAFPAKVIIEKDWLKTENWCIPRRHGNIMSDEFTPYPKNPLIQQFFANIGRTDTIGSGVRNLYKYTPIYSDGGKPELIEDDVFRITIPLDKLAADEAREQKTLSEREQKIYNMICENIHLSVEQVMAELDISRATVFRDYAKIKKVTGAMYDKKTSRWTL